MGSNADSATDLRIWEVANQFLEQLTLPGKIAAWTILAASLVGIFLLGAILALHLVNTRRSRRYGRMNKKWLGELISPSTDPDDFRVGQGDLVPFMRTWLHLLESLRGDFRERLLAFLRATSVPGLLRRRFPKSGIAERILAMETLGSIQDAPSIPLLAPLVRDSDPILSLHAATALLSIDPQGQLAELLPHFLWREDWPLSRVHSFLRESPPGLVEENLARFIRNSGPACPIRALKLLDLLTHDTRSSLLRELLSATSNLPLSSESVLLASIQDPGLADLLRHRIRHPSWTVLLAAVKSLGRVGNPDDIPALTDLLVHPQWWVRYRAAGAIASLPQLKPIQVELLAAGQADPLARDMLRFALAERSMS